MVALSVLVTPEASHGVVEIANRPIESYSAMSPGTEHSYIVCADNSARRRSTRPERNSPSARASSRLGETTHHRAPSVRKSGSPPPCRHTRANSASPNRLPCKPKCWGQAEDQRPLDAVTRARENQLAISCADASHLFPGIAFHHADAIRHAVLRGRVAQERPIGAGAMDQFARVGDGGVRFDGRDTDPACTRSGTPTVGTTRSPATRWKSCGCCWTPEQTCCICGRTAPFWPIAPLRYGRKSVLLRYEPVNPELSPAARQVFVYLQSVYGKKSLVGQNKFSDAEKAFQASGKRPAIVSVDLCGWHKELRRPAVRDRWTTRR
jgi:hypothetical protein